MKVCGLQSSLDLDLWIRIVHLYFEDSLVASESKKPTCQCRRHIRHRSDPCLGQEEALEKEIATHSNILAWRIPWTEESAGLHSMGSHRVGHGWVTTHTHTHYIYCFSQDLIILFYLFGFFKSFNTSLKCDISSSQWRRLWLLGTLSLLFFFYIATPYQPQWPLARQVGWAPVCIWHHWVVGIAKPKEMLVFPQFLETP